VTMTVTERLVNRIGSRANRGPAASRRGFLGGAAVVGAALAVNPWGYLVRPASAYDAVCGTEPGCADGYSVFCCTINGGSNTCPPDSFIGGWWKADNSSFCGGAARYYIDCNAYKDRGSWQCRCAEGTCDQRRVACNQFRYGQCRPDIPSSNTGPVVCRMVSCTPPWQQFGGVCSSSSATDNRTATHAAPCLTGRNPVGSLDVVGASGGALRVVGWAYDPDQSATEIQVAAYVDGAGVGWFPTGRPRDDVNAAYGITGRHGFDLTIPAGSGRHTVDIYAINVGGGTGNPLLGSGSATIGALPRGFLDSWVSGPASTIRVRGWAYDPDEPATAIQVAVYRDGVGVGWFPTGRPRPDVNSVFGISGSHGFDFAFDSPPGDHTIEVFAINVGGGAGNPLVGRGQVRVGIPMGYLDSAAPSAGSVRLSGWAYDPDQPETAIQVAVYRDGAGVGWFPTGGSRPDVNAVFGISGNHGFGFDVPTSPGRHRFEVYAINVGPASGNPLFAASTVSVP
jgi:hypothetical protein